MKTASVDRRNRDVRDGVFSHSLMREIYIERHADSGEHSMSNKIPSEGEKKIKKEMEEREGDGEV